MVRRGATLIPPGALREPDFKNLDKQGDERKIERIRFSLIAIAKGIDYRWQPV